MLVPWDRPHRGHSHRQSWTTLSSRLAVADVDEGSGGHIDFEAEGVLRDSFALTAAVISTMAEMARPGCPLHDLIGQDEVKGDESRKHDQR